MKRYQLTALALVLGTSMTLQGLAPALGPIQVAHAQSASTSTTQLTSAQLQSLVSPVALYPDSLLSQTLMASTYPLEVAEAANWLSSHKGESHDQLQDALKSETWDNSVKSLVMVPDVLQMMAGKLSWTQQLGDAYLAQPKDLMDAVQVLRKKAQQAGNLKSNNQIKVSTQQSYVVIEPANPQVIYVPQYNPTVVYGAWGYPAYPPPPVYNPAWGLMTFGAGLAIGAALWSTPNWRTGSISINNNYYNSFNRNVNNNINRQAEHIGNNNTWRYNPAHRGNVPYTNRALSDRYGNINREDAISRSRAQQYQHRAEQWNRTATPAQRSSRDQAREHASKEFSNRSYSDWARSNRPTHSPATADRARMEERAAPRLNEREMPRTEGGGFRRR